MGFLIALTLSQVKDLVISKIFRGVNLVRNAPKDLGCWERRDEIPILGYLLKKQKKSESKFEVKRNRQVVKGIRYFVNSRTLETAVSVGFQQAIRRAKAAQQKLVKEQLCGIKFRTNVKLVV